MKPKTKKFIIRFILVFLVSNMIYIVFHIKILTCYKTENIWALVLNELVAWNLTEAVIPIVNGTIILKPWTPIATGDSSGGRIYQIDNTGGRSILDVEVFGNKLNNKVSFSLDNDIGIIYELTSEKDPQRITFEGVNFEISFLWCEYDDEKQKFFLSHLTVSNFDEIRLKDGTVMQPTSCLNGYLFSTAWTTEIPKEDGYDFYDTWSIISIKKNAVITVNNPLWGREKQVGWIECWPGWGGVTVYREVGSSEMQYDLFNLAEESEASTYSKTILKISP
jgi:hypothetical protein